MPELRVVRGEKLSAHVRSVSLVVAELVVLVGAFAAVFYLRLTRRTQVGLVGGVLAAAIAPTFSVIPTP